MRSLLGWAPAQIYALISSFRNTLFDLDYLASRSLGVATVSIGNSTMGGSGKTPFTIWLIDRLLKRGLKVGVISRGFKGSYRGVVEVERSDQPQIYGDEPSMMKSRFRQVPIFLSRKRVAAGQALLQKYSVDLILADDGFQHRWLKRNVDVLLIDVSQPLDSFRVFPLGWGRESLDGALARADIICFTKVNLAGDLNWRSQFEGLKKFAPQNAVWCEASFEINAFRNLDGLSVPREDLGDFSLLCGIARPESFQFAVESVLKAKARQVTVLSDHSSVSHNQAQQVLNCLAPNQNLIITEKDAVKWPIRDKRVIVAEAEMKITKGEDEVLDCITRLVR